MRPAFIVDGLTEQRFVQSVCKNRPVKILNCNGCSVSSGAIAKRAATIIRVWGGKFFPIVILVDRESREQSAADFQDALVSSIRNEGITDILVVGVADRMIENWMLGDPSIWPEEKPMEDIDGFNGLAEVRRRMPNYNKASIGCNLLMNSRASEIAIRSRSFRAIRDQLENIKCKWF